MNVVHKPANMSASDDRSFITPEKWCRKTLLEIIQHTHVITSVVIFKNDYSQALVNFHTLFPYKYFYKNTYLSHIFNQEECSFQSIHHPRLKECLRKYDVFSLHFEINFPLLWLFALWTLQMLKKTLWDTLIPKM